MEPFYVELTTPDDKEREQVEKEIFDRVVANGAIADEGRPDWRCADSLTLTYAYYGVDKSDHTLFVDEGSVSVYGDDAVKLTIEEVRELYPLPDEQKPTQDNDGWITLTCPEDVKNITVGDLVRYKGAETALTKHYGEGDYGFCWDHPDFIISHPRVVGDYSKIQYKPAKNNDTAMTDTNTPPVTENVSQVENSGENMDEHYDFTYHITQQDFERGTIKVDPYFVKFVWGLPQDNTGALFHILKNLSRQKEGNSVEREIKGMYLSIKRAAELNGIDLGE